MLNRRRALLSASSALLVPKVWAQPVPIGGPAGFQTLGPGPLWAGVPGNPPSLDLNLLSATLDASITWVRANNNATDGLYTDASGAAFNTFLANAPRINTTTGLLIEPARTNVLLNSGVPVTQTTASLGTGQWWLWVNGAGSATPSAVTATGSGFAAATQGAPSTFTLTVAGTVLVTVSGALNRIQLELALDTNASSYIPTVASTLTRAIDSGTLPTAAWFNAVEGTLVVDFARSQLSTGALPSLWTDANNAVEIKQTAAVLSATSFVANVNSGAVNATGSISVNATQRAAVTYVAATKVISICLNGGPVGFVTATNLPTFTQIKFGAVRAVPAGGFTRRIRYYPRALQVPELRSVTSL